MPGYEATITEQPFTGQSVAPGTWWGSRTDEVTVRVVGFNSVAVWFEMADRAGLIDVVCWDVERFTRVFHQRND